MTSPIETRLLANDLDALLALTQESIQNPGVLVGFG
jgi:hypothetical protein